MLELIKVNSKEEISKNIFLPKKIDMFEINAKSMEDILNRFYGFYQVSTETFFIKFNKKIIGIYGIREVDDRIAIPWLLTTDIPKSCIMEFLRLGNIKFNALQKKYNVMYNYTSSENLISHRWLRYLGFKIDTENPVVISNDKILYKFEWRCE